MLVLLTSGSPEEGVVHTYVSTVWTVETVARVLNILDQSDIDRDTNNKTTGPIAVLLNV